MECLAHLPAFNTVKMAWVAGVGQHRRVGDEHEQLLRPRHARVQERAVQHAAVLPGEGQDHLAP